MTKRRSRDPEAFPVSEYIIAGIGFILIVAVLVFLGWEAITGTGSPPRIVTSLEKMTVLSPGYIAHVSVRNMGEQTASHLRLRAQLTTGDTAEDHELLVDYLPPNSIRMIGVYFKNEPTAANLEIVPLSYQEP
jgi:uncharacterized protein (TIGR02588 family)